LVLDARARKTAELTRERPETLEREVLRASIGERCIARQMVRSEARD
jgi:hypothetical protein